MLSWCHIMSPLAWRKNPCCMLWAPRNYHTDLPWKLTTLIISPNHWFHAQTSIYSHANLITIVVRPILAQPTYKLSRLVVTTCLYKHLIWHNLDTHNLSLEVILLTLHVWCLVKSFRGFHIAICQPNLPISPNVMEVLKPFLGRLNEPLEVIFLFLAAYQTLLS